MVIPKPSGPAILIQADREGFFFGGGGEGRHCHLVSFECRVGHILGTAHPPAECSPLSWAPFSQQGEKVIDSWIVWPGPLLL